MTLKYNQQTFTLFYYLISIEKMEKKIEFKTRNSVIVGINNRILEKLCYK